MNEELKALIIEELGKRHDRKTIIHKVHERTGWNWKQAQQLILLVETQNRKAIAARQSPRLFLLSIGALAVGIQSADPARILSTGSFRFFAVE